MTRRRIGAFLIAAIAGLSACSSSSSGSAGSVSQACAVVRWWADTSGNLSKPAGTPESLSEAEDMAHSVWPNHSATADGFLQLYNDLSSNLSDAAFSAEAASFESANCPA